MPFCGFTNELDVEHDVEKDVEQAITEVEQPVVASAQDPGSASGDSTESAC